MNMIVMCVQRNVGMAAFVSFARHSPNKFGLCTRLKKRYPKNLFYLKNLYLHFSSPFSQESGGGGSHLLGRVCSPPSPLLKHIK